MTDDDRATLSVLANEIRHLREDVEELSAQVKTSGGTHVTRAEWVLRNAHVDSVHSSLRHELNQRRTPWPTVAAVAISALTLIIVLIQSI